MDFYKETEEEIARLAAKAAENAVVEMYRQKKRKLGLRNLEGEIAQRVNSGEFRLAFVQAAAVYEFLLEGVQYESIDGEISSYLEEFLKTVVGIAKKVGESGDLSDCEYLFDRCFAYGLNTWADDFGTDFCGAFLSCAAYVVTESRRQALEEHVAASTKQGYDDEDVLAELMIIRRVDKDEAAALTYMEDNIDFNSIREVAYDDAMAKGDWEAAIKLCLERESGDYYQNDWNRRLIAAREAAGKKG